MSIKVKVTIDGKECTADRGTYIVEVARENGIYIPTLCNYKGVKPRGSCRICTVKVNGRLMSGCTTPVTDGMEIQNNIPEIIEMRKSIIEILFTSGNHYCPMCEKSGDCELQALAYRHQMMVPSYPYEFPRKGVRGQYPKFLKDDDRCILCKRCVRGIKSSDGKSIFAYKERGNHIMINVDEELAAKMTDEEANKAMEICPVGSILVRERGYITPIGKRKYDLEPIGSDIEKQNS